MTLKVRAAIAYSTHDGKVLVYGADVRDVKTENRKRNRIRILSEELRSLLRSKDNLNDSIRIIRQLEKQFAEHPRDYHFQYANRGMFALAVVLYGACFMRGGAKMKVPLKSVMKEVKDSTVHQRIMELRNKLFSHLDENHDVRTDELAMEFTVDGNELTPGKAHLNGPRITLMVGKSNLEWIELIEKLMSLIEQRENLIAPEIRTLMGQVHIEA